MWQHIHHIHTYTHAHTLQNRHREINTLTLYPLSNIFFLRGTNTPEQAQGIKVVTLCPLSNNIIFFSWGTNTPEQAQGIKVVTLCPLSNNIIFFSWGTNTPEQAQGIKVVTLCPLSSTFFSLYTEVLIAFTSYCYHLNDHVQAALRDKGPAVRRLVLAGMSMRSRPNGVKTQAISINR